MGKWCLRLAVLFIGQCLLSCELDRTSEMDGYWEGVGFAEWNKEKQVWEKKGHLFAGVQVSGGDFQVFEYFRNDTLVHTSIQDDSIRIFDRKWKVNQASLPDSLVLESDRIGRIRKLFFTPIPQSQEVAEEELHDQYLEFRSVEDSSCKVFIIPSDSGWLMTVQSSAYTYTSEDEYGRTFSLGPAKVLSLVDGREMHSLQLTYIKQLNQLKPLLYSTYGESFSFRFPDDLRSASTHKLLDKEEHDSLQTLLSGRWVQEEALRLNKSIFDSSEWVSLSHSLFLEANGSFNLEKKEQLPSGEENLLEEIQGAWDIDFAGKNLRLEFPNPMSKAYPDRVLWLPFELLEDGNLFLHKRVTSGYDKMRRPVVIKFKPARAG